MLEVSKIKAVNLAKWQNLQHIFAELREILGHKMIQFFAQSNHISKSLNFNEIHKSDKKLSKKK